MASNADCSRGAPSFLTQADALLRKNLAFQKRNVKQNICLLCFPPLLCILIVGIQHAVESQLRGPEYSCGCQCIDTDHNGNCRNRCGLEFSSTARQATACPIPEPKDWPALLQIPGPQYRAVRTISHPFTPLPDRSCRKDLSCPATFLYTGLNRSNAENIVMQMILESIPQNVDDILNYKSISYLGTDSIPGFNNFVEIAFLTNSSVALGLPFCPVHFNITVPLPLRRTKDFICVESTHIWRENSSSINSELFQGYRHGNPAKEIHEIVNAYDFLNTTRSNLNLNVWYNSTFRGSASNSRLLRIPKSLNMASNAFLRHFVGSETRMLLLFVKEMPKPGSRFTLPLSVIIGPLFYSWVIQLLLPVFVTSLVYEKQYKLRAMMKLHGLTDAAYWMITYVCFMFISSLYMIWFAVFGHIIGLDIFRLNSYGVQFIFYFVYLNLQTTMAFLIGNGFSDVKSATAIAYLYVFGSGLLSDFLFKPYIEDTTFSRWHLMLMELFPGFSLYRGLYELQQNALSGHYQGTMGIRWKDLKGKQNSIKESLVLITLEWLVLLGCSYQLEKVMHIGMTNRKHNRDNILKRLRKTSMGSSSVHEVPNSIMVDIDNEQYDLDKERYKVEKLLLEPSTVHPLICHNLKKVYAGKDSKKLAIDGLSLSVHQGECFGLLGPSGSGKTTFINMMTGFLLPTSGIVLINKKAIASNIEQIHTKIGVCPQHDVIWETLTGREHLLFYGRLRNLKGTTLVDAVDKTLKNFSLYGNQVGDQLARGYSGGMKRRLSVAIAVIGDTNVIFLDEPTTGLDIESRSCLWNVVKQTKEDRSIILTTHSMEEAEFLCDRLGIMVNGKFQCLGNPVELKARYGKSYLFTVSVNPLYKEKIEHLAASLSSNAVKIYDVGGTQKFQLPKQDVRICDVFEAVDKFRKDFPMYAFGLSASSLEDVFRNVVHEASY